MAGGHAIAVSQGNLEIQDGFYTGGMSSREPAEMDSPFCPVKNRSS